MGIFSHNIYENIRTRTIVLYQNCMLLHPPEKDSGIWGSGIWGLPGGGLEPNESIAGPNSLKSFVVIWQTGIYQKDAFLLLDK